MLGLGPSSGANATSVLEAIHRSLGIIEFDVAGNVLFANENFCNVIGYKLEEIKGRHHGMFVDAAYAQSAEYREFWAKLGRGEFESREYKRFAKGGREIWIQATYNPVKNARGKVLKVVKVATDVTAEKMRNAEFESKLAALSRAQAVIEFKPTGEIITANENFQTTLGYRLDELVGQHHRMLCDPAYAQSEAYRDFWHKLNAGEYVAAEFNRVGKGGKEVWIQASYNPVFDMNGKVVKVVKFATDISERVRAVNEIGEGLARLAENDLDQNIDKAFTPAFEKLRADFNLSIQRLQATVQQISGSAAAIRSGSKEIATAADDLSRRTEQQAASLEETAAALDQITMTVKNSADGASHARQVVATADEDAKKSALVVRQAVQAMDGIADSSQKITQIIGVIDEIAFQTNLLALNAGVEAARAGDAGRGFAVVASEVRALAQRSAEAAKEIKGLISSSSAQVEQGVKLVAETGKSLERIMTQVADINGVVSAIADGAKEQSTGLQEINTAITQMDQATQQNAAMVEETTAASHALMQEAAQLTGLIDAFQTGQTGQMGNAAMRRDLQAVAPHAFKTGKPPVPKRPEPRAASPAPARRSVQAMVANGAPVSSGDGWEEF